MKRLNAFILMTLISAFAALAFGQEDSTALFSDNQASAPGQDGSPMPMQGFALSLAGFHEFGYHYTTDSGDWDYEGELSWLRFDSDIALTVRYKDLKLVSDWDADLMRRALPGENYISWSPSKFRLGLGYQLFSWGLADKRNPTDNLNPRDYTVGVDAKKIPVLAADLIYYPIDGISVEAVYVPFAEDSFFPVDAKAKITSSSLAALGATASAVSYLDQNFNPGNFVLGGRASLHTASVDCSLSYLYDLDPFYTPIVTTVFVPFAGTYFIESISLEQKRIQRIGGDAKVILGKLGIWAEAAYYLTEKSSKTDWTRRGSKLDWSAGVDISYGPNDSWYANIQYIGTWIPGFDSSFGLDYNFPGTGFNPANAGNQAYMEEFYRRSIVNAAGLETEGLIQGATINLKWELFDGFLTPQITALYAMPFLYDTSTETRYGSLALKPELDIKPFDSFHISFGADLAYSWHKVGSAAISLDTEGDRIGIYTPSNNLWLKVLYKWSVDLKK